MAERRAHRVRPRARHVAGAPTATDRDRRDPPTHRPRTRRRPAGRTGAEHGRGPGPRPHPHRLRTAPGPAADARRARRRRPTRRRSRPDRAAVHPHHPHHRAHPAAAAGDRLRRVRIDGRVRRTGRLGRLDPGPRRPPHHRADHHRHGDLRPACAADRAPRHTPGPGHRVPRQRPLRGRRRGPRRPRRRPGPVPARRGPAAGHRVRRTLARPSPAAQHKPTSTGCADPGAACCGWPPERPTRSGPLNPSTAPTSSSWATPPPPPPRSPGPPPPPCAPPTPADLPAPHGPGAQLTAIGSDVSTRPRRPGALAARPARLDLGERTAT